MSWTWGENADWAIGGLTIQQLTNPPALVVTTAADVLDGDVSSMEALNANRGADGEISLREAIRVGQGMTFDGLSVLTATDPDEFNLNQFAYGFWFNRSSPLGYENLIGRAFGDGQGWTVHLDPSGYLKLRVDTEAYSDQQLFSSVSGLADGAWHFGAVSMDMATRQMSITVDGRTVSSGNYTGNFSAPNGGAGRDVQ